MGNHAVRLQTHKFTTNVLQKSCALFREMKRLKFPLRSSVQGANNNFHEKKNIKMTKQKKKMTKQNRPQLTATIHFHHLFHRVTPRSCRSNAIIVHVCSSTRGHGIATSNCTPGIEITVAESATPHFPGGEYQKYYLSAKTLVSPFAFHTICLRRK